MNFWHMQMHLPYNKGGVKINPKEVLEKYSVIVFQKWNASKTGKEHPQSISFREVMQIGDIVVVRKGQQAIALCRVTSDVYSSDEEFIKDYKYEFQRKVEILKCDNDKIIIIKDAQPSIRRCADMGTSTSKTIVAWYNEVMGEKEHNSEEITMKDQLQELLEANHNLVLTGAPGTGKTFLAKEIAEQITEGVDGTIGFVQFHSSYDYTDFVEGVRPVASNYQSGSIDFERRDGIFKEFCKRAAEDPGQDYVFIIDEINRAEPSRVLGELFFAIDPGYRGIEGKVQTQYANLNQEKDRMSYKTEGKSEKLEPGYFYVPDNVFIIGTMNDIDRNVDSMDFAMRRRFVWKEILASDTTEMLIYKEGENEEGLTPELAQQAKNRMANLNNQITKVLGSTAFHIGAAYFLKLNNYNGDFGQLWDLHIKPLLSEYLGGKPEFEDKLKKLKSVYDDTSEHSTTSEGQS